MDSSAMDWILSSNLFLAILVFHVVYMSVLESPRPSPSRNPCKCARIRVWLNVGTMRIP